MIDPRRPGAILVTGAPRGIGLAIAELFLSHGWRVGMYDVDATAVAVAAAGHRRAVHGVLDVRDAEQWRAVLREFCGDDGSTSWSTTPGCSPPAPSPAWSPPRTSGWST